MKKNLVCFLLFLLYVHPGFSQNKALKTFPLNSVRLLDSPFYQAQQTDMEYIIALDPDKLLAPFMIEAEIEPKAERYGNWENTGLDGHIGGHYLSALALMYASTGNQELLDRLNYMVNMLEECQKKNGNGYVGGVPGGKKVWKEIANGNIDAGSFSLNGKWVPLYNIHKTFAGLRDAYLFAGNKKALNMLIDLSNWFMDITANLTNDQMQEMLRSEHGGMNEVFADVADIMGEKKYLDFARKVSHLSILNPLLKEEDKLTGLHANTQIPKVIGYKRVADVANDEAWAEAADFFWETVVDDRSVSIGGNSVREHFHPINDFSSMMESNQGPETCNTYNMLRLTNMLFLSEPDAKYLDFYERGLYNHILSSQHPTKGGFVYFTPMRPRHYRVYSQPDESFWCCVGSGLENHGKYGELIYAHNDKDIYVNLFIPSELEWKERGISLTQNTQFPFEEKSDITLKLEKSEKFKLYIRHPGWSKEGEYKVNVNNKPIEVSSSASSYVVVERKWKNGDVITVELPMHTKSEFLPDNSSWVSFTHGPLVLAAVTDSTDLQGLWADDSRMGHVANGPLYPIDEAPMVVVEDTNNFVSGVKPVENAPLTFTAAELVYPDRYKDLQLVPFFRIHDARYMIYWPVVNRENLQEKLDATREKEHALLALEAQTVDQIATGEQQPEAEHNFKGESTDTGINQDYFWRDARGWFSYELSNENKEGKVLRITYFGGDKDRSFDIMLNNTLLATVNTDETKGNVFYDVDYEIPADVLNNPSGNRMILKFVAHEGSIAGGIYHIRLLKEESTRD